MNRRHLVAPVAVALVALAGLASGARAAGPAGAYYTAAQAAGGAKLYAANCSQCHGAKLEGVSAPALKGPAMHGTQPIGDLYGMISQQMPAGAPGSLSPATYTAIMAYLLKENGHPAGKTALTPASVKKIAAKI